VDDGHVRRHLTGIDGDTIRRPHIVPTLRHGADLQEQTFIPRVHRTDDDDDP